MTPAEIERLSDLARSREECGRNLKALGASSVLKIEMTYKDPIWERDPKPVIRRELIQASRALTDYVRAALIKELTERVASIDAEMAQWGRGDR